MAPPTIRSLMKNASILIVDDDPDVLTAVRLLLKTEVKEVVTEKNPEQIKHHLTRQHFDLVMLDMNFASPVHTGNEGLFWLRKIQELHPGMPVIMITAYGAIDLAVTSLKEGASDFVIKPWHNEKLLASIREALQSRKEKAPSAPMGIAGSMLLGNSPEMQEVFIKLKKVAPTDANILVLGENGTGKDLIAKAIHENSLRAAMPFIKVDMGSLTESLFESELFGHKRGAFTDAREDRIGLFESANGGTLFLDEIGNISLQQQAKLLSVLQNRQVMRLGTNTPTPIDIRLICATNVPLSELANEARFRKDLIYRINTVELQLPPLRHRKTDIPLLAEHFVKQYAGKYMKPSLKLAPDAVNKLMDYHFPGNVRELQYIIERAVIMCDGEVVRASDLFFSPIEKVGTEPHENDENMNLNNVEKNTIMRVIDKHNGNISRAAKELGLTRTALYRRLSKYDI
ncbi:MAG TPA: sigma-54 dependent transcriptional regulator [Phnomibacter sp.]|nr:sigma-54 dependent transcriptional regulator [Phnomibacter sp.]